MRGIFRTMIVSAAAAAVVVGFAAMASAHDWRGHDHRGHWDDGRRDGGRWEYVEPRHHPREARGWGPPPVVYVPRPVVIPQHRPVYVAPTPSFNIVVPLTIR